MAVSSFPLSSLPLFLCFHPSIPALCSLGRAVIMVERGREGGRCDYCLVGSQKNRSAQKYVVRERGTVSDIINTLETYSESARPRARSHMLMNTHVYSCAHAHTHVITHKVPVCTKQAVFVNIKSYKHTATQITSAHNVTHSLSTDC